MLLPCDRSSILALPTGSAAQVRAVSNDGFVAMSAL
jgi:hypothetical protein